MTSKLPLDDWQEGVAVFYDSSNLKLIRIYEALKVNMFTEKTKELLRFDVSTQ